MRGQVGKEAPLITLLSARAGEQQRRGMVAPEQKPFHLVSLP